MGSYTVFIHIVMGSDDRGNSRVLVDNALGPSKHMISRLHLEG